MYDQLTKDRDPGMTGIEFFDQSTRRDAALLVEQALSWRLCSLFNYASSGALFAGAVEYQRRTPVKC
jgi:hypothetical protein